jgi:hypothetical protein
MQETRSKNNLRTILEPWFLVDFPTQSIAKWWLTILNNVCWHKNVRISTLAVYANGPIRRVVKCEVPWDRLKQQKCSNCRTENSTSRQKISPISPSISTGLPPSPWRPILPRWRRPCKGSSRSESWSRFVHRASGRPRDVRVTRSSWVKLRNFARKRAFSFGL